MTNENYDHKSLNDGWVRFLPERFRGAVVPVVRLNGAIGAVSPLRPGLTLSGVSKILEKAFETKRARAVALVINSPGGSPVQSRQIYARIRQLAETKRIPVLAFVEDVAASGGYMIACAADEIFCDPSSILGSIGVIGGTFGFQDLIKKVGIERRLYTSGDHKGSLDPFLPENPDDVARLKAIQRDIHDSFIDLVKKSRGARLQGEDAYLFSGEYWAGTRSVKLGFADGIGDVRSVLRARYGERVRMPVIAPKSGLLSTLAGKKPGAGAMISAGFADDLISALEARALWARYGL